MAGALPSSGESPIAAWPASTIRWREQPQRRTAAPPVWRPAAPPSRRTWRIC